MLTHSPLCVIVHQQGNYMRLWRSQRSVILTSNAYSVTFSCYCYYYCFTYSSPDFVQDNVGELVPEGTFTHSHLSSSSIIPWRGHIALPHNTIYSNLRTVEPAPKNTSYNCTGVQNMRYVQHFTVTALKVIGWTTNKPLRLHTVLCCRFTRRSIYSAITEFIQCHRVWNSE